MRSELQTPYDVELLRGLRIRLDGDIWQPSAMKHQEYASYGGECDMTVRLEREQRASSLLGEYLVKACADRNRAERDRRALWGWLAVVAVVAIAGWLR